MKAVFLIPPVMFAALLTALAFGLSRDPAKLPTALMNRPGPDFTLPPLPPRSTPLSDEAMIGEVRLVNVFASWCAPCIVEHPLLTRLAAEGVRIDGIAYKDEAEDARRFLQRLGDPYADIGLDLQGRAAIDWGVYGVPETFVVDREGRIRHRHVGELTEDDLKATIRPLLHELSG